ncbi:MAG TPA: DUF1800 domain-containing protein [Terracidiphilus sp.]|nr:DUF1800 domain-containing protein [Terracidiphilus sp.]
MDFLRAPFAVLLSILLCVPAPMALAQAPSSTEADAKSERPGYHSTELHGDARILHALNRFTFGPRPGDLEAVRAEGVDKWFDQQLHPKTIDESALFTRIAQFPAMQMSVRDLMQRYPSNALVRMAMNGKIQIPTEPIERAIYENQIYRIRMRQQGRANDAGKSSQSAPGPAVNVMNPPPAIDQNAAGSTDQPAMAQGALAQAAQMDATDAADQTAPATDQMTIRDILSLPPDQRVTRLASIREPEFDEFVKSLKPLQRAALVEGMSPEQRETVEALAGSERMVAQELMANRLMCDIYSNAQLLEVMTDFWLNHFNVYLRKNEQMPYYLVSYERDTIRPYALGRFEDLLEAVAHSPAMLIYLDNAESVGAHSLAAERFKMTAWRRPNSKRQLPPGINENYGRELMELHTVGVNGGYTQDDVIEASKVLTGWTVERPQFGGGFVFNPNRHEPGTKTVMGTKIKQSGEKEGEELLHMLATRPATAQMLSRELAVRFVSDNPPQSLIDRMAKTYMSTSGNISAVIETLFHSPEFWAESDYHAKVKTPLEYVVSAVRASGADVTNYMPLMNALRVMGMPVYGCVQPNGYAWTSEAWVNTGDLVDRMNFALMLAGNRLPGIKVNWSPQTSVASNPETEATPSPAQEEIRLEPQILPGGASATTRAAALQEFQRQNAQNGAQIRPVAQMQQFNRRLPPDMRAREDALLAGLLIGSPDFQRR